MRKSSHFSTILLAAAALSVLPARGALAYDALIEGAKQCTQYFPIKEREQGIPAHLLAAISSIETGRYHSGLGLALPWPWTINVDGKGYYFATKAEAIAKTQRFIRSGHQSIDVGCMQVNLKHHANAFASLDDAFDPEKNVGYAAKFLRANYADLDNSWVKAAAAYHSRTPSRGNPYLEKVARAWQKIVVKVQQAQARSGATGARVAAAPDQPVEAKVVTVATKSAPTMKRIASTRSVKVISVKESTEVQSATNPNMVAASYTPDVATPQSVPMRLAVREQETLVAPPLRRISVDNAVAREHTRASPTFVFAN
jgi:hypothetical protein